MIAKAVLRYIRITPRKFRQIIPLVKDKPVEEAIEILTNVNKKASLYAIEVMKSALSNAKRQREGIDTGTLYISKIVANCGPSLKRFRAASMGRATMIKKRMSHIIIELDEKAKPAAQRKEPVKGDTRAEKAKTGAKIAPKIKESAQAKKAAAAKR